MDFSENQIAKNIVDRSVKVHQTLGPGLLESSYEKCLYYELKKTGLYVKRQVEMPLKYDHLKIDIGYRVDMILNSKVIIEIKAVEKLTNVHMAQLLTYLKLSNCKLGILINFNVNLMKNGLKRIVNNL
jgi:GxxExxY protein